VMARGVGPILLGYIMRQANIRGKRLQAEFIETGRNRMMQITFQYEGFREVGQTGDVMLLEHDLTSFRPMPPHVAIDTSAAMPLAV
jgi:hypothetical protein